jgi:hypothetical protein
MTDNVLLAELIAKQRQDAFESGLRNSRLLELVLQDAPRRGLRTRVASLLMRLALHIDASASARAAAAQQ